MQKGTLLLLGLVCLAATSSCLGCRSFKLKNECVDEGCEWFEIKGLKPASSCHPKGTPKCFNSERHFKGNAKMNMKVHCTEVVDSGECMWTKDLRKPVAIFRNSGCVAHDCTLRNKLEAHCEAEDKCIWSISQQCRDVDCESLGKNRCRHRGKCIWNSRSKSCNYCADVEGCDPGASLKPKCNTFIAAECESQDRCILKEKKCLDAKCEDIVKKRKCNGKKKCSWDPAGYCRFAVY